jgi:hypothetical protein
MGRRGPHSQAELSIVAGGPRHANAPPDPPDELTPEEGVEWTRYVRILPRDQYTPDMQAALVQLCRHTIRARLLAKWVCKLQHDPKVDGNDLIRALGAEREQSRVITSLMTKLRLTPQSRYGPKKTRGATSGRPWDTET